MWTATGLAAGSLHSDSVKQVAALNTVARKVMTRPTAGNTNPPPPPPVTGHRQNTDGGHHLIKSSWAMVSTTTTWKCTCSWKRIPPHTCRTLSEHRWWSPSDQKCTCSWKRPPPPPPRHRQDTDGGHHLIRSSWAVASTTTWKCTCSWKR